MERKNPQHWGLYTRGHAPFKGNVHMLDVPEPKHKETGSRVQEANEDASGGNEPNRKLKPDLLFEPVSP